MSVTFKLKKNAKFQDGTPVTAKDVKWSFDRAVIRRRLSDGADEGRLARQQGSVRRRRRRDLPRRFRQEGSAHHSRSRRDRARHLQFRAGEEERHRQGSLGARIHQEQHRRQRRLQGDELEARRRSRLRAQRRLGRRQAARAEESHLAHHPVARQPPRLDGARRRRHLLRSARQGLLRDEAGGQAQDDLQSDRQRHVQRRNERGESAVQQREGPSGRGLRDPLQEDRRCGDVRRCQSDVRRPVERRFDDRLAATHRLRHRHRQGQGADGRRPAPAPSTPRSRSISATR